VRVINGKRLKTNGRKIKQQTHDYTIYLDETGKYTKEMKYKKFATKTDFTQEETVFLYKALNEQNFEGVSPMSEKIGLEFHLQNFYINPYESFDDETGLSVKGVSILIETLENEFIATSSKTVYYNIQSITNTFGMPNTENYKPLKLKIKATKQKLGNQISLELLGF
jgi:hypothetical protein